MVKGLRVISDFEWEFQMNHLNRTLAPDIETMYLMASPQFSFVSSSGVKEIASFGGNVEEFVPPTVARALPPSCTPKAAPALPSAPRSRLSAMDVLVLIDKLDDLVHNAKAVPLTDQVRIDREEIYDILDQMRATIPEEIKQARWIVKERQEMLAEAKRECDRILGEAREQAVREASQTEIVKLAERQAQEIIDDARRKARETKLEMEDWADSILSTLEVNLEKFLARCGAGASGCTSARRSRSWSASAARPTSSLRPTRPALPEPRLPSAAALSARVPARTVLRAVRLTVCSQYLAGGG